MAQMKAIHGLFHVVFTKTGELRRNVRFEFPYYPSSCDGAAVMYDSYDSANDFLLLLCSAH